MMLKIKVGVYETGNVNQSSILLDEWCMENLKDEQLDYFLKTTD